MSFKFRRTPSCSTGAAGRKNIHTFWEGIKPTFDKYYDVFSNFVYRELNFAELNVERFELTYVNIIPKTEGLGRSRKPTPDHSVFVSPSTRP